MKKTQAPVVIEFIPGSRVQSIPLPLEEALRSSEHTSISFSTGESVQVPTDQIIHFEDAHGAARIGLGGMSFEGLEETNLVFWRVRDLYPEESLHPARAIKVTLDTSKVASVHMQGTKVWPRKPKTRTSQRRAD